MAETFSVKLNNQMCVSERSHSLHYKKDTNRAARSEAGKQVTVDIILERNDCSLN